MVYYNRILGIWILDAVDYFLISAIIGSLLATYLKDYLSEKASMERLKKSIIAKSNLATRANKPILKSKKTQIKTIYKFALNNRGGQFPPEFPDYYDFENVKSQNELFRLAHKIKGLVEILAAYLKRNQSKGLLKIFFKQGQLILELLLYKCKIDISYGILTEGLNTHVIVYTLTTGGVVGFTVAWCSVGMAMAAPPVLVSALLLRSLNQQIAHRKQYSDFKKLITEMLNDDKIKETIQAVFTELPNNHYVDPISKLKMDSAILDDDIRRKLKHDFEMKSGQNFEEFIKARMKEEFDLIENPTMIQIEEKIHAKVKKKPKGKTVFFRDIISEISYEGADLSDSNIIDTEILKELELNQIMSSK
jgi:hypothetical protein